MAKLYGSVEAGGTKFICAVGDASFSVIDKIQFPTTSPEETIDKVIQYFKQFHNLVAISIGSFGPIDLNLHNKTYGFIMNTPKPHWSNINLLGNIQTTLKLPIYFTTDVNSSAYGEIIARDNISNLVYYTVGTGIGAGAYQNGNFIGGISHSEMGHTYVAKHKNDIGFDGVCPFHKGCLEGMASGPSIEARTGIQGKTIAADHEVWDRQAYYIAQAAIQASMILCPEIIVFGGGVMAQDHMLKRVHNYFTQLLNSYISLPPVEQYIVKPAVAENGSATLGNFALAHKISG